MFLVHVSGLHFTQRQSRQKQTQSGRPTQARSGIDAAGIHSARIRSAGINSVWGKPSIGRIIVCGSKSQKTSHTFQTLRSRGRNHESSMSCKRSRCALFSSTEIAQQSSSSLVVSSAPIVTFAYRLMPEGGTGRSNLTRNNRVTISDNWVKNFAFDSILSLKCEHVRPIFFQYIHENAAPPVKKSRFDRQSRKFEKTHQLLLP